MMKLLLPIDGSPRSLRSIETITRIVPPEKASITILTVAPGLESARTETEVLGALELYASILDPYEVKTVFLRGIAGPVIVQYAKEEKFDAIVMTRSSRGPMHKMGSVSSHVAKHADFLSLILLQEDD